MKKSVKFSLLIPAAVLALALIVTAVIFFIPRDNTSFSWECFQLRMQVSGFLKDVKKERYEDAFDAVWCFSEENGDHLPSDETLKALWVNRVSGLKTGKDATYLDGYSKLKVRKENGDFYVSVVLSVTRQGYNDPFYANGSPILVELEEGKWKIVSVSSYGTDLQTNLEKALSGAFSAQELGNAG